MKYILFSTPACPVCSEIKEYLDTKKIKGEEHSMSDEEGMLVLRKIYPQIKNRVKRKDDSLPMPVVVFFNESNEIINVANDLKKVKQIVENKAL